MGDISQKYLNKCSHFILQRTLEISPSLEVRYRKTELILTYGCEYWTLKSTEKLLKISGIMKMSNMFEEAETQTKFITNTRKYQ